MNIHVILFLVLFISIVNLFYPKTTSTWSEIEPPSKRPSVRNDCNLETSNLLFTTSGWLCQNKPYRKGDRCLACKSVHARENDLNQLIDVRTGLPVDYDTIDLFETYVDEQGERVSAYRCQCDSLDDKGNRMINVTPYECLPDYCMRELENLPSLGWNGQYCECGMFENLDPNDSTTPCVRHATRFDEKNAVFYGRVDCTNRSSFKMLPLLCPNDNVENVIFKKGVGSFESPLDFVRTHRESQPRVL